MNLLDPAILAILGFAAYNGYRRGAVLQLASYAGLVAGLLLGALVAPRLAGLADSPPAQAAIAVVVLLSFAGLGDALGWFVGRGLRPSSRTSAIGTADAVGGSLTSVVASLVVVWFVALNLVSGPIPEVSRAIRGSAVVRVLDSALPHPPAVLARVRQFLNQLGFPEVFAGLPVAPAGPVQGPAPGAVRAASEAADQSTLRILGEACGAFQEGTAFVAAPGYVITNAHVVAGVDDPVVQHQNDPSSRAVTVLFDPVLDVAVLFVPGGTPEPLALLPAGVDRGTGGAVLGYPGGGGLSVSEAAVRQTIEPIGRDIYGRSLVRRDVYELQTVVRPGNSGGPFVLLDGSVAGVVFAASTTDPSIGYALTSPQVRPLLDQAVGRTSAVDTGDCIR